MQRKSQFRGGMLGIIRLDYDYPPAAGDIDSPLSYDYKIIYRVVPGLTFMMCQLNTLTPEVEERLERAILYLDSRGVNGITGDCGFMMYFQERVRKFTKTPVFMSALAQLPAVTCAFASNELIAIFTANGKTLLAMDKLIKDECGVDENQERYFLVGCENVPGFEAVAAGEKVNVEKVTPGIVARAKQVIAENPTLRAILMECTELPPYSDAVRAATGLPVYDAITACNFFMSGVQDNPRFGLSEWQEMFNGNQESYEFGQNLTKVERSALLTQNVSLTYQRD